VLSAKSST
ncbi:hypothetical protein ACN42_g11154, partial [Penicillium freii]